MIGPTRGIQRLLLPVCIFLIFCTLLGLVHDHPAVTAATQKAQQWGSSSATHGTPQAGLNSTATPASTRTITLAAAPTPTEDKVYSEDNSTYDDQAEKPVPQLAPEVSAADLLKRPIATRLGTVPKIFHQSWIDSNLPAKFQLWSKTCRAVHHDYEWVLWTNEDNEKLVEMHFPWLLKAYKALPGDIYRADLARNLYMYIFGGVYADLDTDCLRSANTVFENYSTPVSTSAYMTQGQDPVSETDRIAFFGRMGTDRSFEHSIPNAWMAATPGHPFFLLPLQSMLARFGHSRQWKAAPETVTGPVALRQAILKYRSKYNWKLYPKALETELQPRIELGPFEPRTDLKHSVVLLHQDIIYPYSWWNDGQKHRKLCWVLEKTYDANRCKMALDTKGKGSVAITYWSHTHSPTGHNKGNMEYIIDKRR